ncbi:MAG: hypothetical protein LBL65_07670 [Campylobacteraceae bacterium]|nr:hypothetical protein [Campylobacteraceae bacterium]
MRIKLSCLLSAFIITSLALSANENTQLPIKKVSLFSSGIGYFERAGEVTSSVNLTLPFETSAMDDALKSLIVYDPATNAPIVSYASDNLQKTLSSFKINLSANPSIAQILASLKGAEIEIYAPGKIIGKIIGVETKNILKDGATTQESFLSIFTQNKIELISLKEIVSYAFTDKNISRDLARALDVILNFRQNTKYVNIYLPSSQKRLVSIGYVIPAPVWKTTYRLDLFGKKPFLQGWAIVDNAGDSDWRDVELSLVVGRPASFTQPLYAPYFLSRPILPLSIAGVARARSYDTGFLQDEVSDDYNMAFYETASPAQRMQESVFAKPSAKSAYDVPNSKSAGEQFVFTLKNPVTLERGQSAMFPFVQGDLKARKVSIFTHISQGTNTNPALGAEIINNLELKLPAGAISVYDGDSYAGDALMNFLADGEKRFISYGDDLALIGTVSHSSSVLFEGVKISKGVLSITEKTIYEKTYTIKNNDKIDKNIILEHPFIADTKLVNPIKYAEKTASSYRFEFVSPAGKELKYSVKEERPNTSITRIANMDYANIIAFSTNKNFSKSVKTALQEAAKLMSNLKYQEDSLKRAKNLLQNNINEQERVRKNIEAVGSESTVGKEYVKKLTALDIDIEKTFKQISEIEADIIKAQQVFNDYIEGLEL